MRGREQRYRDETSDVLQSACKTRNTGIIIHESLLGRPYSKLQGLTNDCHRSLVAALHWQLSTGVAQKQKQQFAPNPSRHR